MTQEQLRTYLRRNPFQPFRIYISSGHSYVVNSPDWMMVTPRTTAVGIPGQSGDGDVVVTIDNLHIAHVEPVTASTPPSA